MTNMLSTVIKKIYYNYLPNGLRRCYGPKAEIVYSLVKRVATVISDLYLPLTYATVNSNKGPYHVMFLIAGRGGGSSHVLRQISPKNSGTTDQINLGKTYLWNISRIDKREANALIVSADRCLSPFLTAKGFIPIPEWVHFTLDLTLPKEEIMTRFKKRNWNNYRRIRKHPYSYEVVHDLNKLDFFYHRMYVPFIKSRYGDTDCLDSFTYMKSLIHYGELLFVKLADEYVGGFLLNTAGPTPRMAFRGILDGRNEYIEKGISSAMYYFAICWAKEKGYKKLDFGHCRPFLEDGVLQFKRRWGMHIHRSPRVYRTMYLLLCSPNASLREFLINNPILCEDQGQLKGLLFSSQVSAHSEESIESLKSKYAMPGLDAFSVITFDNCGYSSIMKAK
jgi:hypothetical protein